MLKKYIRCYNKMGKKDCWVYTLGEKKEYVVVEHFGTIILEVDLYYGIVCYIGGYSRTDKGIINDILTKVGLSSIWSVSHNRNKRELTLNRISDERNRYGYLIFNEASPWTKYRQIHVLYKAYRRRFYSYKVVKTFPLTEMGDMFPINITFWG